MVSKCARLCQDSGGKKQKIKKSVSKRLNFIFPAIYSEEMLDFANKIDHEFFIDEDNSSI